MTSMEINTVFGFWNILILKEAIRMEIGSQRPRIIRLEILGFIPSLQIRQMIDGSWPPFWACAWLLAPPPPGT
jgi:hypothetical protein